MTFLEIWGLFGITSLGVLLSIGIIIIAVSYLSSFVSPRPKESYDKRNTR